MNNLELGLYIQIAHDLNGFEVMRMMYVLGMNLFIAHNAPNPTPNPIMELKSFRRKFQSLYQEIIPTFVPFQSNSNGCK